jgi:flagellar hook-associated protein 1 FlgK
MSLSRILNIASRGLSTYQRAMDLTSHNISNAGNSSYSRQRALLGTGRPEYMQGFEWGTGVTIDRIDRIRNRYVDNEMRVGLQNFSSNEKRASVLGRVEQFFGEPSAAGISDSLTKFFSSFSELSVSPNSIPLRNKVVSQAQNLASNLQSIYSGVDTIKNDTLNEFNSTVDEVNMYLQQVQEFNTQISNQTLAGGTANDLMDKRDLVIDKLSELVNINVTYDNKNSANISIGGTLAADVVHAVEFRGELKDGKLQMVSGNENIAVKLTGGELAGLSKVYSIDIPEYINKIDSIFSTLVDEVNRQHSTGYNLGEPPVTGVNFFSGYSNGVLTINQDILNDPANIAISSDGTSGNGDIALAISDIANQSILDGSTLTESYASLMSKLGTDIKTATDSADATYLVLEQLQYERSSYSGVSIDEEMTNVIMYQKSYDASAKLVKVADEMLSTLINMV